MGRRTLPRLSLTMLAGGTRRQEEVGAVGVGVAGVEAEGVVGRATGGEAVRMVRAAAQVPLARMVRILTVTMIQSRMDHSTWHPYRTACRLCY